jgi:hypothetical protein
LAVKRALALALIVIAMAGCGGASGHFVGASSASSAPTKYTKAQALVDINSPDKETFCRALDWDLGNTGFMS